MDALLAITCDTCSKGYLYHVPVTPALPEGLAAARAACAQTACLCGAIAWRLALRLEPIIGDPRCLDTSQPPFWAPSVLARFSSSSRSAPESGSDIH